MSVDADPLLDAWAWSGLATTNDWTDVLRAGGPGQTADELRRATDVGKPCGDESFIHEMERRAGRRRLRRNLGSFIRSFPPVYPGARSVPVSPYRFLPYAHAVLPASLSPRRLLKQGQILRTGQLAGRAVPAGIPPARRATRISPVTALR